jgi:hypothetical protein
MSKVVKSASKSSIASIQSLKEVELDFKRQGLKQVPDEIGNFLSIYI